jgi:uncharacterized membrane protein YfcA
MGWEEIALLFAGGVLAGCISVLAEGAGFMTFPLLVAAGMSEIEANASNFVALVPANLASIFGYRYAPVQSQAEAAAGARYRWGACGSLALLGFGEATFRTAIPWLLTFSTMAFALVPHDQALARAEA